MALTVLVIAAGAVVVAVLAVLVVQRARRLPGAFTEPDYWPYCLDDFGPLLSTDDGGLRCETCGRTYSAARLEAVDPDLWAEIARDRLFCRECAEPEPGVPCVYSDEHGPVPCPTHGTAPPAPPITAPSRRRAGSRIA